MLKIDDGWRDGLGKKDIGMLEGRRGMGVGKEDKGRILEERMEGG